MKEKSELDSTLFFFVASIGIVALGIILSELQSILLPFVIASFLFILFSPVNTFLTEKKIPLGIIIFLNIIVIAFISFGVIKFVVDLVMRLSNDLPNYFSKLNSIVRKTAIDAGINDPYFKYFSIQKILTKIDYKDLAGGVFNSVFSLVANILFLLFFFIFIVSGHKSIFSAIKRRYYNKSSDSTDKNSSAIISAEDEKDKDLQFSETLNSITEQIQKYVISKISLNLLAGIFVGFFLYLLNIDFAIMWGLLTFFLNFIPSIGSAIALIMPTLMAIIQYESWSFTFLVAGGLAGIQTLFFNLLEPHLIGKRLNLNPVAILLSVLIWGYIWGILGMLLAVPLTAIIKIIIANSKNQNLRFVADLMSQDE
ncbi:MAG: AI-2E family transporter [Ignavibacteriaceae bacterium]